MDDQVTKLVDKIWNKYLETPPDRRLLIAIAGIPGSGKTTLAQILTAQLNARHSSLEPSSSPSPIAVYVPMDGFHLTRAQLSAMPDPTTAHARRGAEFTFDGAAFLRLAQRLREPLTASSPAIFAPSFDHAAKDPREDDIAVLPTHRVAVLEGNYLALDREPWRSAAALADEVWFVEVGRDVARRRLVRRHLAAGIAADEAEAERRADENDLRNGDEILSERVRADEVIVSNEDEGWVHR
ncbi:Phosphoribulokinase/uridine kinase [Pleurostoma richardsiae]|uniref:Phosphoribulokinase/uridine kinase n=1 Tax=Pleurostoma richardsiae TaxID=41990 RepID=A0AA38RTG7_9PEZI|nr:Phosphoribulokinase/uridine kinase [Pleurostoma richardsiae]